MPLEWPSRESSSQSESRGGAYYIMHFVLHVQFIDTVRAELPPKRPSVTYIWASETFKGMQ